MKKLENSRKLVSSELFLACFTWSWRTMKARLSGKPAGDRLDLAVFWLYRDERTWNMEAQCKLIVTYQPFKNNKFQIENLRTCIGHKVSRKYRLDIVFLTLYPGSWLKLKKYLRSSQVVRSSRSFVCERQCLKSAFWLVVVQLEPNNVFSFPCMLWFLTCLLDLFPAFLIILILNSEKVDMTTCLTA